VDVLAAAAEVEVLLATTTSLDDAAGAWELDAAAAEDAGALDADPATHESPITVDDAALAVGRTLEKTLEAPEATADAPIEVEAAEVCATDETTVLVEFLALLDDPRILQTLPSPRFLIL
jgi:hypothetical protein